MPDAGTIPRNLKNVDTILRTPSGSSGIVQVGRLSFDRAILEFGWPGWVGLRLLPVTPVVTKQLCRVRCAVRAVAAAHVAGGAIGVTAPANALRVLRTIRKFLAHGVVRSCQRKKNTVLMTRPVLITPRRTMVTGNRLDHRAPK